MIIIGLYYRVMVKLEGRKLKVIFEWFWIFINVCVYLYSVMILGKLKSIYYYN